MIKTDLFVAGCGCSGLYFALHAPRNKRVLLITKSEAEKSDSFLAQGGMCMLTSEDDYETYFEDTLVAGHYENDKRSVELMIRSSQDVVADLVGWGVDFKRDADGNLLFTREGAHRANRIVFHEDITGKEITSHLLEEARRRENITILEQTTLIDLITKNNHCYGGVLRTSDGTLEKVMADVTVLATGGVGGVYRHSTNYRHLTGDGIAMALRHKVALKDATYVQIHPTTFYAKDEKKRSFLISESVRGEGAKLYDKNGNRFVDELLPRDVVTAKIHKQMEKDGTDYVWEDLRPIPEKELDSHFPNIVAHCKEMGYDPHKECIPVVPAQHYFMGGIRVNHESKTSMEALYAVGETACNGVHGKNRLASNSLLESLVFAKRAAKDVAASYEKDAERAMEDKKNALSIVEAVDLTPYQDTEQLEATYRDLVVAAVKEGEGHV